MQKYLGTKLIQAEPLNLGDYNKRRGWTIPENEDPNKDGYYIVYPDGYVSWSPKEIFKEAYRPTNGLSFGLAIEALKKGKRVTREGWNGKGMYLYYVPANTYPAITEIAKAEFGDNVPYGAYIAMKTAQNNVVPWLASQTDVLAEDFQIVE